MASESVALDALGAKRVGDLPPGGLLLLRAGEEPVLVEVEPLPARNCIFERIYFARPDSQMEEGRVYDIRWRLGERLGREWRTSGKVADVVIPVPDTSRPAAQAMAETLGLPFREGFIKNRYSGRTFIMPDAETRAAALRLKLNVIPEMFEGKRVILVDDSVVRGTTVRRLADLVRQVNPAEVHLAVYSPPVRNPCFYGIDMSTIDELYAPRFLADGGLTEEAQRKMAENLECDSLRYLPVESIAKAIDLPRNHLCQACITGEYPTPHGQRLYSLAQANHQAGNPSERTYGG